MTTTQKLIEKYGNPLVDAELRKFEKEHMILWDIPEYINRAFKCLPNRLYVNRVMVIPLTNVYDELITGFHGGKFAKLDSLITFDGCFNPRPIRGTDDTPSTHGWALAVDHNAFRNGLGKTPSFSKAFIDVWKKHGFKWGGDFTRKDGMHFEFTKNL